MESIVLAAALSVLILVIVSWMWRMKFKHGENPEVYIISATLWWAHWSCQCIADSLSRHKIYDGVEIDREGFDGGENGPPELSLNGTVTSDRAPDKRTTARAAVCRGLPLTHEEPRPRRYKERYVTLEGDDACDNNTDAFEY
ncbi:hypothetical protein EVAR_12679_1 [Eumeta japonica]|uniref:Uncharacterized protein n=1 Tax=Eumeta variegata TaxID=151549 RepID=A0A4C1Z092_EUMVA|nr:hypothetical protein EVAR_12679_1 [Eumeta japonica]